MTRSAILSVSAALPRTIAIVREDNIGDLVVTLPLMAELKKQIPGVRMILFARSYVASLVPLLRPVDDFVPIEGLTVEQIQAFGIDVALFPQGKVFSDVAMAFKQAAVHRRYGTWRSDSRRVLTGRNSLRWGKARYFHEARRALSLLDFLGIPQPDLQQAFASQIEHFRLELLEDVLKRPRPYVVLHTQSNKHGREWPMTYFLALQQALHQQGFDTVLTGMAPEREVVLQNCPELLASPAQDGQGPGVVDVFGQLDLRQLAGVLRHAHAVVSASTGPLHLGAGVGARVIGLYPPFRGGSPEYWGGIGPDVVCLTGSGGCKKPFWTLDLRQSHCNPMGTTCRCMYAIQPEQVLDQILTPSLTKPSGASTQA